MKALLVSPVTGCLKLDRISMLASCHFHGRVQRLTSRFVLALESFDVPASDHHDYHLRKNAFYQPPLVMPRSVSLLVKDDYIQFVNMCEVRIFPVVNDYIYNVKVGEASGRILSVDDDYFESAPSMGWPSSERDTIAMRYHEVKCRTISPRAMINEGLSEHFVAHAGVPREQYYWAKSLIRDRFIYWSGGFIMDPVTAGLLEVYSYEEWFHITEINLDG